MKIAAVSAGLAAAVALGAVAAPASAQTYRNYGCRNDNGAATGTVVGAIAGGVIGSNVAHRGDRTAGTVIGALIGGLAGNAIGHSSSSCDNRGYSSYGGYGYRQGYPASYGGYGYDRGYRSYETGYRSYGNGYRSYDYGYRY